jgi:hypothetical protein
MKLEFAGILHHAGKIVWKNKILWMFSAPVGFAAGLICLFIFGFNSDGTLMGAFIKDKIRLTAQDLPPFTDELIILILCFTGFAFYIFNLIGSIGTIKGIFELKNGKTNPSAGNLLSESRPFLRSFFILNFPLHLAYFFLITPVVFLLIEVPEIGFGLSVFFMIIFIPAYWLVQRMLEQVQPAMVLQGLSLQDALKSRWEIVVSNLGSLLLMSLILGLFNSLIMILTAVFVFPVLPILGVLSFAAYFGYADGGSPAPFQGLIIGFAIYTFGVTFILNTFFAAYRRTVWTLSHLQLVHSMDTSEPPAIVE